MRILINVLLISTLLIGSAVAQGESLTLEQVIERAKKESIKAKSINNRYNSSFWSFKLYKASYLPALSLNGSLPNFDRSISPYTMPDGSDIFVRSSNVRSDLGLSLSQKVGFTGADIFVNSSLQRIDVLKGNVGTSYMANPVLIGINQPLFTYNAYKWDRKIAPMLFEEAKRELVERMEEVSIDAINRYFDLLSAQITLENAEMNTTNIASSFKIAQGRYELGTIAENDLLEMELSLLESQNQFEQAKLDLRVAMLDLKTFLGMVGQEQLKVLIPDDIKEVEIDSEKALEQALANRKDVISFERQITEANRDVAKAKTEQFSLNMFATYGLANRGDDFDATYTNLEEQQRFRVGVEIPLMNWGKGKAYRKIAESNLDLALSNVELARTQFEREIFVKSLEIDIMRNQVITAKKAQEIGQKRYHITKERYLIGNIDITDYNLALKAKDRSISGFISSQRTYWVSYYNLRMLTLYDFEAGVSLIE